MADAYVALVLFLVIAFWGAALAVPVIIIAAIIAGIQAIRNR